VLVPPSRDQGAFGAYDGLRHQHARVPFGRIISMAANPSYAAYSSVSSRPRCR
jgi:hypothetical protein